MIRRLFMSGAFLFFVLMGHSAQAQSPKVRELRIQKTGKEAYFHVVLEAPEDLRRLIHGSRLSAQQKIAIMPRLVPRDGKTQAVYPRWLPEESSLLRTKQIGRQPIEADALEFVGKVQAEGPAKLLLLYPKRLPMAKPKETQSLPQFLKDHGSWGELPLTLDFARATKVPAGKHKKTARLRVFVPDMNAKLWVEGQLTMTTGFDRTFVSGPLETGSSYSYLIKVAWTEAGKPFTMERRIRIMPGTSVKVHIAKNFFRADPPRADLEDRKQEDGRLTRNDLPGLWATAQMQHFAVLEQLTPELGFHSFACETTAGKYGVALPETARSSYNYGDESYLGYLLYQVGGSATSATGPLTLLRLRRADTGRKPEPRNIDVGLKEAGGPDYPWKKKLAGRKPIIEPIAGLVPYDNYYIYFKNIAKFLEAGDQVASWGALAGWFLNDNSDRDFMLKDRLERQLCLKSDKLARIFGPAVVKGLAVTGNDPYVREGSDVTVIFQVANKDLFLAAVEPNLKDARAAYPRLKQEKSAYRGVTIESFVSPLREVSLHRAIFDDFIVHGNSPVGVRRVIDAHKGKLASLAGQPEFKHLRTVYPLDDPLEDGLMFVSEAFLSNLISPALRIKERRRLEGLTSLSMLTNGALFSAWETGKLPASHAELLAQTKIRPEQLFFPDGDAVWDPLHKIAVSSFYNTLNFATPLIEIPIKNVTASEKREYETFRVSYAGAWRRNIDPLALRIRLAGPKADLRLEAFVMPLVDNGQFFEMRRLSGDGTIKLDPSRFGGKTIVQFISHFSPKASEREMFRETLKRELGVNLDWLGDWFTFRLDDSPVLGKLVERRIRNEIRPDNRGGFIADDEVRLLTQLPLTFGVEIRNPLIFIGVLTSVKKKVLEFLPGTAWEPMKEPYRGTKLVEIKIGGPGQGIIDKNLTIRLYYALVDGVWFISLRPECIHDEIDAALARKKGKLPDNLPEVNTSLYGGPKAALHGRQALALELTWEANRQAVVNNSLLHVLYRGGLLTPKDDISTVRAAAFKYLGFTPGGGDFADFVYHAKTDEVIHKRHGTMQRPSLPNTDVPGSPLTQFLAQLLTIRADMRFRDDGMHTVVTFKRQ